MRTAPQLRLRRPTASFAILAALTGAGCSGDVSRFAYLDAGTGNAFAPAAYEARPVQQVVAPNANYAATGRGQLPPPAQSATAPTAMPQPTQVAAVAPATRPVPAVAPAGSQAAGGTHTVVSGDNLWTLARRYGVSRSAIAARNGLADDAVLRVGQTLQMPRPGEVATPTATQVAVAPQVVVAPRPEPEVQTPVAVTAPAPATVATTPQPTAPAAQPAAPKTDLASAPAAAPAKEVAVSSDSGFRWPVRGRVISEFGQKPDGQKNDGINLVVPEGTPVKASRDGEVIYAGSELEGYGNLVLVRHPGNWVTAYAHNSELLVKRGDTVRRGQPVAKAGRTGSVSFPQVHFEIRKGATPVDPMTHLEG